MLIGDEPHASYERPPLSKALLRGEADLASAHVHASDFYEQHDIEVITDTVTAVDPAGHRLRLGPRSPAAVRRGRARYRVGPAQPRHPRRGTRRRALPPHHRRCTRLALRVSRHHSRCRGDRRGMDRVGGGGVGPADGCRRSARGSGAHALASRLLGEQIGATFLSLHADHGVTLRMRSSVRAAPWGGARGAGRSRRRPGRSRGRRGGRRRRDAQGGSPRGRPGHQGRQRHRRRRAPRVDGARHLRRGRRRERVATRDATGTSGSSTGRVPSTRVSPPARMQRVSERSTTACRTSSPISTTSASST